jgi:hypothetical protein
MGRLQGLSGLTTSVCSQSRPLSTPHGILLRGEPLDVVAREANVSVAKLTEWRERALAGAASALKERERDDREDEIARLKSKVGEITMDNELLSAKIAAMEAKSPLARRRSRR